MRSETMQGRVVVITGAGSGIGRALALISARSGAHLALSDINEAALADSACLASEEGRGRDQRVLTMRLDVSQRESFAVFAAEVSANFGRVDFLFNNAAVSLSQLTLETEREDFEWLFNINFWGVVNGCEAFRELLGKSSAAHIINISSLFGLIGVPTQAAYCASKFAVRGYSESLRAELGPLGIKVSTVFPGGVATNIVRNGRHYKDMTGAAIDSEKQQGFFAKVARLSPDAAARMIVRAVLRGKTRIRVGSDAIFFDRLSRLMPEFGPLLLDKISHLMRKRANRHLAGSEAAQTLPKAQDEQREKAAG